MTSFKVSLHSSGAVCSPRPSHSPDAFANSLRKYPNMSPERSAELVERLIHYTQQKNGRVQLLSQARTRSFDHVVPLQKVAYYRLLDFEILKIILGLISMVTIRYSLQ